MHGKIYTIMAGGMGDIALFCLHPNFDLGYFKHIKTKFPNVKTKVILWSVNDQAHLLLRNNPYIDRLEVNKFVGSYMEISRKTSKDYKTLTEEDKSKLTYERPVFYLDKTEEETANSIVNRGPYVVVHPFAGSQEREFAGRVDTSKAISELCNKGVHVVLVGGSSHRSDANKNLKDDFVFEHENLTNLIDKHTVRLHAHLTSKSSKFIGTVSAYNCVASEFDVKSLLFTCEGNKHHFENDGHGIFQMVRDQKTPVYFWNDMPSDPVNTIVDFVCGG